MLTIGVDDDLEPLVAALRTGRTVALPTDTVYGVGCAAHLPDACERLLNAKGRGPEKPSALLCGSVDTLFTTILPELHGHAGVRTRRLLPGPITVVVPNPGRRFRWLCGSDPSRIGLRVPVLDARLAAAIDRIGALLVTSANLAGEPPAVRLEDLPAPLVERIAVAVDGGPAPGGRPSTVVDVTGPEPLILREGPVGADEIARRLADGGPPAAH
jgi:tRNA threonylcarbamoyl adenosine modification protein (Sua5/YciO/YrdC/YwlC family)